MKNLLSTKHASVGVVAALFTGLLWVAMFRYFVHMSLDDIRTWILPVGVVWALLGLSVGLIGKRNGSSLYRVAFSSLFGTGLSPIAILPLMGFVVLPLGKLAEWLGLINRATISSDLATTLAVIAMLAIWLVVGIAIGSVLLFVSLKRTHPGSRPLIAPEQRL